MFYKRIYTESIAQYSYLVGDKDELVVIDPQQDINIYMDIAEEKGMKIKKILETHRNEDFLIGSTQLAKLTGAKVYISGHEDLGYEYGEKIHGGDELKINSLKIKVLHTPGHTKGHLSYALYYKDNPYMVFTGDTIFNGALGRADFYGKENLDKMTEMLYKSIFEKIFPLGDDVIICPAHGAGSACGENVEERPYTTVGYERKHNPKLQAKNLEEFIEINAKMQYKPTYFSFMEEMNLKANQTLECNPQLKIKYPEDVKEKTTIIDIRSQHAYNNNHIKNSIYIHGGEIAAFINWIVDREEDILFISDNREAKYLNKLNNDMRRIGYTGELSFLSGGILSWIKKGKETDSIETVMPEEFKEEKEKFFILDVRKKSETTKDGIETDMIIPIEEISDRYKEIPKDKDIVVVCPSGIRSNIVSSFLKTKDIETKVLIGGLESLK